VTKGRKTKFVSYSKALYGLHQTPHVSYTKVNDYLCNIGPEKKIKNGNFNYNPDDDKVGLLIFYVHGVYFICNHNILMNYD